MRSANIKKLTEEQVQERLARYARSRDTKIRDEVVLQYANLVESIARRFLGACEPLEDLVQEGYVGLIRSVDKYDVNMGVKFSTYATHFIIGEIKHYLRDKGKMIKEPAWLQELNQRMSKVVESLNQKFGRAPTEKEIAEVMQMSESSVRELLTTREVFKVTSLDGDREDLNGPRESEKIKDQKLISFQLPVEDKIVLETALERLKDIEQEVISAHYYKGLNQTEIAKKLGISCNYVSHILRNGTKKLKKILVTDEIRDTQMQRTLLSRRVGGEETMEPETVLDSVTRVYNRHYFLQRLDEELSRAFRDRHKVALLLVNVRLPEEIDRYVRLIRTDDVLYAVAQCMRESLRKMDVLARFSDTCFGLILPHTTGQPTAVVERMRRIVESVTVESGRKGKSIACRADIGMARYPADAETGRDLLRVAANNMGIPLELLQGEDQARMKKAA
ncbi:MAG: sigma-70 family RNA polymerase sigma factor [Armatimonadetes bacterium]|nr:sigma-70 family RNA polymerase sigma factor [Armatimonadota bacterium]